MQIAQRKFPAKTEGVKKREVPKLGQMYVARALCKLHKEKFPAKTEGVKKKKAVKLQLNIIAEECVTQRAK